MFKWRMAYDLSRPIVDNGRTKKCLPTLDFLLTPARAFCTPASSEYFTGYWSHTLLCSCAAAIHWAGIGIIGSVLAPQVLYCDKQQQQQQPVTLWPSVCTSAFLLLANLSQDWAVTDWIKIAVLESRDSRKGSFYRTLGCSTQINGKIWGKPKLIEYVIPAPPPAAPYRG